MPDPNEVELRALTEAIDAELAGQVYLDTKQIARVAFDHFAPELARLEAIEAAAQEVVAGTNHYQLLGLKSWRIIALRAALKGTSDD